MPSDLVVRLVGLDVVCARINFSVQLRFVCLPFHFMSIFRYISMHFFISLSLFSHFILIYLMIAKHHIFYLQV